MRIDGANVLVTGASSGIGASLAPLLAARGATVGIVARREERLAEVLSSCQEHNADCQLWVRDLGDPDDAAALALEVWDAFGCVDVLVNNAAIPKRRMVQVVTPDEVDEAMRVNFTSPVRMTLALLPRMLERDHGMIVNVSSLGGRLGILQEAAYCASKFALCGWSESLAADLWETGVDVRLINPGPIDTEIWDQPGNDPAHYEGPFEPPSAVAEAICSAIESDAFETYTPDLRSVVEWKTANIDDFLHGVASQS